MEKEQNKNNEFNQKEESVPNDINQTPEKDGDKEDSLKEKSSEEIILELEDKLDRSFAEGMDDYYADPTEVNECGRDCSGTGSSVSDESAALLGNQQFQMYTEFEGERHEKNLINDFSDFINFCFIKPSYFNC